MYNHIPYNIPILPSTGARVLTHYSTILISMCATVSTDIPSYKGIHGRMPLHYYCSLISDTFRLPDFMNYPFSTCPDTQTTHRIYRFECTDCISEVSWYVYWIEVNGNRDDFAWISEAYRPETHRDTYKGEVVWDWQQQIEKQWGFICTPNWD